MLRVHDGGRRRILGVTGRNFAAVCRAASPTFGIRERDFASSATPARRPRSHREDEYIAELREMLELHREYTGSPVAPRSSTSAHILKQFVKVMPT